MLRSPLFSKSWHDVYTGFERQAAVDVEKLDEKIFSDPQLAASLEKIVAKYRFEVAKLGSQAGTAKAVKFNTGRAYVDALEVPVPFTGDARSLNIRPSHSNIISVPAVEIQKEHIVVTVYEAGNPGQQIEDFIKRGNENLDSLREEVKRYDGELLKTVTSIAARRKASLEERKSRDAKLPFRVDRS